MDFSSWPHTIWIQTLGLLKPGWVEISTECTSQTSFSCSPNLIALKQYHSLNSVYHKFREALVSCPERPTTLALCRASLEPIYFNLLRWLQANKHPQFLTCYTEGALQLMLHPFMSILTS